MVVTSVRSPGRWGSCSTTRTGRGPWARPGGPGWSCGGAGTFSPARCASCSPAVRDPAERNRRPDGRRTTQLAAVDLLDGLRVEVRDHPSAHLQAGGQLARLDGEVVGEDDELLDRF